MPDATSSSRPLLGLARVCAVLVGLAAGTQAFLGVSVMQTHGSVVQTHKVVAMVAVTLSVVTAVVTWLARRHGIHPSASPLAIGVAVLALVQFALGELGLEAVHISVGLLFLIGAIALIVLTLRRA